MKIFKILYDKLIELIESISYELAQRYDLNQVYQISQFDNWSYTKTINTTKSVGRSDKQLAKNFTAELIYDNGILTNFKLVSIDRWYDPSCIPAIISYVLYDNEEVIAHTMQQGDSINLVVHKYVTKLKVRGCYIPILYGDDNFFCVFNNDKQYIAAPIPKRLIEQTRKHFSNNALENLVDGAEYVERPTDHRPNQPIIGSVRTTESIDRINRRSTTNYKNDYTNFDEFRKEFFEQFTELTRTTNREGKTKNPRWTKTNK